MTLYSILFYLIAGVIVGATGMAITRRNLVHAVVYLVISFFGTAMMFYLLGAPLLAALEVIVYAGAIMILFLFILMMLKIEGVEEKLFVLRQWIPAMGLLCLSFSVCLVLLIQADDPPLAAMTAEPAMFGQFLFRHHWLAVEAASLLLLIALMGALHLGMENRKPAKRNEP